MSSQPKDNNAQGSQPVDEKIEWLHFESGVRRWGTLFLFIFVVAGGIGLLSKGYISQGYKRSGNLSVEYERFGRIISDMSMKITVNTQDKKTYTVVLDGDFMDTFEILTLHPVPVRTYSDGAALKMVYNVKPGIDQQVIWLGTQPRKAGMGNIRISLDDQDSIPFRQFIYP
ncbi:hypothetical protein SIL08_17615 [Scandinavium sp. V105_16]|uniref:Uncharacterized protein n=1 Tax=Scandinavium lactucae TaxID=3095028 RepID=A0AAJ2VWE9_9ENTR|nr:MULTISPECIES: hypothetical protein [unclassified Scandinavium]MDX6022095.1 hypothetical protein [Scandinavium sp. V105_16]MDX6034063.1 hypothetical protein [Scandinavium sp. V105_12]MDX6042094.1 hypothetical protein [Scandinavium sp. V105_6]MDX6052095.1 hypothetical protein [Scandinavium sp. V105_1]